MCVCVFREIREKRGKCFKTLNINTGEKDGKFGWLDEG